MTQAVAARLGAYCAAAFGGPLEAANFPLLAHRWESDIYAFDLCSAADHPSEPLVLRLYNGTEAGGRACHEHAGLRAGDLDERRAPGPLRVVYGRPQTHTGLRLPAVEALLDPAAG